MEKEQEIRKIIEVLHVFLVDMIYEEDVPMQDVVRTVLDELWDFAHFRRIDLEGFMKFAEKPDAADQERYHDALIVESWLHALILSLQAPRSGRVQKDDSLDQA